MKQKYYIGLLVLVAVGIGYFFALPASAPTEPLATETAERDAVEETAEATTTHVTVSIEGIHDAEELEVSPGTTALGLLELLDAEDASWELVTEDYGSMGVLVEGIGERQNGDGGLYWQYSVDGVMPMVGADVYEIQDGDTIEWKFTESQF